MAEFVSAKNKAALSRAARDIEKAIDGLGIAQARWTAAYQLACREAPTRHNREKIAAQLGPVRMRGLITEHMRRRGLEDFAAKPLHAYEHGGTDIKGAIERMLEGV